MVRSLTWSSSHEVFVPEIDDEHREIFEALSAVKESFAGGALPDDGKALRHLVSSIAGHFAHEERLMRAARYGSLRWHKTAHDNALRRVGQLVARIEAADLKARRELIEYLTGWLRDHTRLADRMLGAFLRNHQRAMFKMTFRAGTKAPDGAGWTTVDGGAFDPERLR